MGLEAVRTSCAGSLEHEYALETAQLEEVRSYPEFPGE